MPWNQLIYLSFWLIPGSISQSSVSCFQFLSKEFVPFLRQLVGHPLICAHIHFFSIEVSYVEVYHTYPIFLLHRRLPRSKYIFSLLAWLPPLFPPRYTYGSFLYVFSWFQIYLTDCCDYWRPRIWWVERKMYEHNWMI